MTEKKRKNKRIVLRGVLSVILTWALLLGGCELPSGAGEAGREDLRVRLTDTVMGTVASMTIYVRSEAGKEEGEETARRILKEVRTLEEQVLSKRLESSEVWRINHESGADGPAAISAELYDVLDKCQRMTEDSQGAFDVRIGNLTTLWNIDEIAAGKAEPAIPDEETVKRMTGQITGGNLGLFDGKLRLDGDVSLDLGSVGKGVALDRISDLLDQWKDGDAPEIAAGVFSLGGSILTYGDKPDGTPWKIAVVDPALPGETLGTITLPKGGYCTSTSGDYERYFELGGRRWHHILDPTTGYPTDNGVRGVTIISESGFLSDALSTACFVLGREKGMELAKKYGAEILMVCENGEIVMSDGMKTMFLSSN